MGGPRGAEPPWHFHWQNILHPQHVVREVRLKTRSGDQSLLWEARAVLGKDRGVPLDSNDP